MTKDTTTERANEDDQCTDSDSCPADSRNTDGTSVDAILERVEGALNRRAFLRTTASAGVGLSMLSVAGSDPTAGSLHSTNDEPRTAFSAKEDNDSVTDIDVLNYALTLEQLEATFYTCGQEKFSECEIENSAAAKRLGKELQSSTYDYFNRIRDHEQTHVEQLTTVINDLGGEPVSGLEFEFPLDTVEDYFALARTFENLGVSAYDGAIALIDSGELQTAGATIATVEARHASYLNLLTGEVPFPDAFDEPKSMEDVRAAASEFIVEQ
ncbi:ferritin-like domain-containing protein [Halocatena halophila]|uniref:ferritin-like domain-containing protein n=1 Tax=Halocatena halophila TaxID=2814576 RepID=UPI002ED33837